MTAYVADRGSFSLVLRRISLCFALTFALACSGCSSSLPTRSAVISNAQKYIDQTLDGVGYTGPREFDLYWGQCMGSDSAHGGIAVIFGFPTLPTQAAGEALMAKMVAYWRSNSVFSNVHASSPSVDQTASVDAPGTSLAADASYYPSGDQVSISVHTCYNSPGPAIPTETEVGDPSK